MHDFFILSILLPLSQMRYFDENLTFQMYLISLSYHFLFHLLQSKLFDILISGNEAFHLQFISSSLLQPRKSEMFISRRFLMSRKNIFTVVYVSVILFFLYYRFVLNEYKVKSLTLKKYIMHHHDPSGILHMNEEQAQMKNILFWTKFWNKPCIFRSFWVHSQMMSKEWSSDQKSWTSFMNVP